jgi:hypothetical protein
MKSNFYAFARVSVLAILLNFSGSIQKIYAQQFLTTVDGWNAYVHLPDDYNDSVTKKYPLICFIPGTGECGTDPSRLLSYGPSKFVADGHNMQFMVNGKLEKPIVISLQPVNLWPSAYTINRKLDTIFARYRCDLQRINATGLSMGGWSWDNYVDNYSPLYTNRITSIVAMSAPEPDNTISNMKVFSQAGGKWWGFEGTQDYRKMNMVNDTLNYYRAGSARYTSYVGGHCCWNTWYNPTYSENGESIYTFMLKQKKPAAGNNAPQVTAGRDTATVAVLNNFSLAGNANDPDGNPITFRWSQIQGPLTATIANAASAQTGITGLAYGTYKFELRVTDVLGAVSRDTLLIANGLGALPVVLTDFSAKVKDKNTVSVVWSTSAEVNFDYFIVERSTDPQIFAEGTKVAAKGTGSVTTPYYFTDLFPENGLNFYRLKMVDKDGQFAYSKVVSVTLKKELGNSISVSSAYATGDMVQIKLSSLNAQPATLSIVDANGKKLYSSNISLNKGVNDVNRNVYLPRGVYYVNLNSANEKITKAFIKE